MYYYRFHIGDYQKDTAHLNNNEDLAYRRLLDMYYSTERPIPLDTQWVSRRLRVETEWIASVLNDFWQQTESGWINPRADREIEEYRELCRKNQLNGKQGGRPRKTQSVPSGNPNHKPITNNQYPVTPLKPSYQGKDVLGGKS